MIKFLINCKNNLLALILLGILGVYTENKPKSKFRNLCSHFIVLPFLVWVNNHLDKEKQNV